MNDRQLEEFLWRALESPVGIEIECSDVETLKRRLYSVRAKARESGNQAFDSLAFITPPIGAELKLWLVKQQEESK